MKKIPLKTSLLTIVLWTFSTPQTFAQAPIDLEHNSFRIGDVLKKQKIIADDIWDLSQSLTHASNLPESYEDLRPDTVTCIFNGIRKYYVYHSDSLLYVGAESPQIKDSLYLPITSCRYPMTLGDSYSGFFASYVSYCDKMMLHKYGTYVVNADSIGTIVLPNGDTMGNALEIKQERIFMYEEIDSCTIGSLPTYSESDILRKKAESGSIYRETETSIYVKGYRYPIVTDFVLYNSMKEPCLRETYYCPPEEQESLPTDEQNTIAREHLYSNDAGYGSECTGEIITSYIRQNKETKEITFDCTQYFTDNQYDGIILCKLIISDNKGILYRSKEFSSDSSSPSDVSISYSGLRRGQYVVSLVINNQTYSTNFYTE